MGPENVNWLAVLVAALSSFVLGGLWYSPLLFGRAWMKENGLDEETLKRRSPGPVFGGAFVLALLIATNLAFFLGKNPGLAWGATAGALAGIGWVCASLGIVYLFERRTWRLFFINAGYQGLAYVLMGAIIGLWQ